MTTKTTLAAGQIWKEVDPRLTRFIRIRHVCNGGERIAIETVSKRHGAWLGGRWQEAAAKRFNGKRGGYAYVEG